MGAHHVKLSKKFVYQNPYTKGASGCANAVHIRTTTHTTTYSKVFTQNLTNTNTKNPAPPSMSQTDLDFLCNYTGASETDILMLFQKFHANNPLGQLMDKEGFEKIYSELKKGSVEDVHKISDFVFKAFDMDHNGLLSVNEFMVSYFEVIMNQN